MVFFLIFIFKSFEIIGKGPDFFFCPPGGGLRKKKKSKKKKALGFGKGNKKSGKQKN